MRSLDTQGPMARPALLVYGAVWAGVLALAWLGVAVAVYPWVVGVGRLMGWW